MDREQVRSVALDNACRLAAAWQVEESNSVLALAGQFEAWLTRPVVADTDTATDTSTDTDTASCPMCPHRTHAGICTASFFKGYPCACDHVTDTAPDTSTGTGTGTDTDTCQCGHARRTHTAKGCVVCWCTRLYGNATCVCSGHGHETAGACRVCACPTSIRPADTDTDTATDTCHGCNHPWSVHTPLGCMAGHELGSAEPLCACTRPGGN